MSLTAAASSSLVDATPSSLLRRCFTCSASLLHSPLDSASSLCTRCTSFTSGLEEASLFAVGITTDTSGASVAPPSTTICSLAAAKSRPIICISSRSCSTDSSARRVFSRSCWSSRCRLLIVGPLLFAGGAAQSPLNMATIATTWDNSWADISSFDIKSILVQAKSYVKMAPASFVRGGILVHAFTMRFLLGRHADCACMPQIRCQSHRSVSTLALGDRGAVCCRKGRSTNVPTACNAVSPAASGCTFRLMGAVLCRPVGREIWSGCCETAGKQSQNVFCKGGWLLRALHLDVRALQCDETGRVVRAVLLSSRCCE
eukprot:1672178-Pleurochrysis_carterae.AAC.2